MKKILLSLLMISAMLLSGCSAVSYHTYVGSTGKIADSLVLPFDQQYFLDLGATASEYQSFKALATEYVQREAREQKSDWDERVELDIDITDKDAYKNGVTIEAIITDEVFELDWIFENSTIRKKFYGETGVTVSERTEETLFTKTYIIERETKFASQKEGVNIVTYYMSDFEDMIIQTMGADIAAKVENPQLAYVYGYPSSRLHSDADQVVYDNGFYLHVWEISPTDVSKKITIYTVSAKPAMWYVIILGATLVATGVMFLVYFLKKKKQKKEQKTEIIDITD